MNIDDLGFKNERVKRLVLGGIGDNRWPLSVAKSRLSEILRRARNGEAQVIGIRKPVIVSVQELERIAVTLSEPETWGERFFPRSSKEGLGITLELPTRARSVVDSYDLDSNREPDSEK